MTSATTPLHGDDAENRLRAWRTGIDTYQEPVVYMHRDCAVCRSEGFTTQARVQLTAGQRSIVATLSVVDGPWLGTGCCGPVRCSVDVTVCHAW